MSKTKTLPALALAASLLALALPASADRGHGPDGYRDGYRGGGSGGAVLYADAGFSGQGLRIDGAVPDLARVGFNDKASSITVRNGAWQVCVDSNFRGRCEIIDADSSRLNAYRLNDNISSIRPAGRGNAGYGNGWQGGGNRQGGGGYGLVLYPDSGLRGSAIRVNSDIADLSAYRFNDKASSFQVSGGSWLVCSDANYRGRCQVLSSGAGDLTPIRMNDNISSIRRYSGWR